MMGNSLEWQGANVNACQALTIARDLLHISSVRSMCKIALSSLSNLADGFLRDVQL